MTLVKIYADGEDGLEDVQTCGDKALELLNQAALCCDGSITVEDGKVHHLGDPTETAIVYAAYQRGKTKAQLETLAPRVGALPFDSDRKLMTTVHAVNGRYLVVTKGAFDMLALRCVRGDLVRAKATYRRDERLLSASTCRCGKSTGRSTGGVYV